MQVTKRSPLTGVEHTLEIDITPEQHAHWEAGLYLGFLQEVFPHLDANDRDFLLTGITADEWSDAFSAIDCE